MPPNEPATPGTDRPSVPAVRCTSCGFAMPERGSFVTFDMAVKLRDNPGLCLSCIDRRKSAPMPAFNPGDRVEHRHPSLCLSVRLVPGCLGTVVSSPREGQRRVIWDGLPKPTHHDGWLADVSHLKPAPAQVERSCPGHVGSKPCELPLDHAAPCMVEQKAVPAQGATGERCADCGVGLDAWTAHTKVRAGKRVPGQFCRECYEAELLGTGKKPEPGQSPPDTWGIPREVPPLIVRHVGADPYAKHRAEERPDGDASVTDIRSRRAIEERHHVLRQSTDPLDRLAASRIASARHAPEREAGVKRFDAWVSVRHAREAK